MVSGIPDPSAESRPLRGRSLAGRGGGVARQRLRSARASPLRGRNGSRSAESGIGQRNPGSVSGPPLSSPLSDQGSPPTRSHVSTTCKAALPRLPHVGYPPRQGHVRRVSDGPQASQPEGGLETMSQGLTWIAGTAHPACRASSAPRARSRHVRRVHTPLTLRNRRSAMFSAERRVSVTGTTPTPTDDISARWRPPTAWPTAAAKPMTVWVTGPVDTNPAGGRRMSRHGFRRTLIRTDHRLRPRPTNGKTIKITPDGTTSPILEVQGPALSVTVKDTDAIVERRQHSLRSPSQPRTSTAMAKTAGTPSLSIELHPGVRRA